MVFPNGTFKKWKRRLQLDSRSPGFVFAICFLIATMFWFLKTLDQQYTTTVSLPFKIRNLPGNRIPRYPLPSDINILLTARGWDLLSIKLGTRTYPVFLDFSKLRGQKKLYTNKASNYLKHNLPNNFTILNYNPDTLNLQFDKRKQKQVPVRPDIELQFASQYGQAGPIEVIPEKISITGPAQPLNNIRTLYTEPLSFTNLKKSVKKKVEVQVPGNTNVKYSPQKIQLNIPVEKLTEKELNVFIRVGTDIGAYTVKIIPEYVKVIFQTPLNRYDQISAEDFKLTINPGNFGTLRESSLPVQVKKQPKFIYNMRLEPEKVHFIKKKFSTKSK